MNSTTFSLLTDLSSSNIVTGPQRDSASVSTCTSAISSTHTKIERVSTIAVKNRKCRKRKRSGSHNSRTSIDNWMKRKKAMDESSSDCSTQRTNSDETSEPVVKSKNFSIILSRFDDPTIGQLISTTESGRTTQHSERVEHWTFKEIIEAKEKLRTKKNCSANSELLSIGHVRRNNSSYSDISSICAYTKMVKTRRTGTEFKATKSKSVIRTTEKKSVTMKTLTNVPKLRKCFVRLKRLKEIEVTKVNNRKQSPQQYKFKRSFEKITVTEKASTVREQEVAHFQHRNIDNRSPNFDVESSITNDPSNQPSQSSEQIDSTLTTFDLDVTSPTNNVPRPMCFNNSLSHAELTSPDMTTSSTPQCLTLSDGNTEPKRNDDAVLSSITCNVNLEKRLQIADDFENDIPSPEYSPLEGRRKHISDENKPKTAANCRYLIMHKSKLKNNGNVGDSGTNSTISSSPHILSMAGKVVSAL